jgi:hypothetical protein
MASGIDISIWSLIILLYQKRGGDIIRVPK